MLMLPSLPVLVHGPETICVIKSLGVSGFKSETG